MSTIIDTLITDRTQADVEAVAALNAVGMANWTAAQTAEYLAGMKGAYNASDLNRVGKACSYLYFLFVKYGYDVPGYVNLRKNWSVTGVPTAEVMNTYLGTIAALRAVWPAIQAIPSRMDGLTWEGANNIEKLLAEIYEISERLVQGFIYSGEAHSGEF